jgi:hypothetical protein
LLLTNSLFSYFIPWTIIMWENGITLKIKTQLYFLQLLKDRENKIKEHEEAQARQKQYEENLRMGKIKKKGRKSKVSLFLLY